MKIEKSQVVKITISDVAGLDPVHVVVDDIEPGKGRITITCYSKSWTAFWGAMGKENTLAQFFRSCGTNYIAENLSKMPWSVDDVDTLEADIKRITIKSCRYRVMEKDRARTIYDDAASMARDVGLYQSELVEVSCEDWLRSMPKKPNPDYVYLCKIINAVKAAFEQLEEVVV